MDLILNLIFSYRNFVLAAEKGESPWKWAFITFIVWLVFESTGGLLYASIVGVDLTDVQTWSSNKGMILLTLFFAIGCGYLGYLLVRKSLQSRPDEEDDTNGPDAE